MPEPPRRTPEQREAALRIAAAVRKAQSQLKLELKQGTVTIRDVLARAASDRVIGRMKVLSVLEALPGTGKVKALRAMDRAGISLARRLAGLTRDQRARLIEVLDQLGWGGDHKGR